VIRVVAGACVIVMRLLVDREEENNSEHALDLMRGFCARRVALLQPPHCLAEVAAVLTRLSPQTVDEDITNFATLNCRSCKRPRRMTPLAGSPD
jgi:hypothetical protein